MERCSQTYLVNALSGQQRRPDLDEFRLCGRRGPSHRLGNGVGNEGSGIYPLAAQPNRNFYTNNASEHRHEAHVAGTSGDGSLTLPYIQLLTCQKD